MLDSFSGVEVAATQYIRNLLKVRSGRLGEEPEILRRCLRLLDAPDFANPLLDSFEPQRRYSIDGSPTINLKTVQSAPAP
jgi:hypothetical protein